VKKRAYFMAVTDGVFCLGRTSDKHKRERVSTVTPDILHL